MNAKNYLDNLITDYLNTIINWGGAFVPRGLAKQVVNAGIAKGVKIKGGIYDAETDIIDLRKA